MAAYSFITLSGTIVADTSETKTEAEAEQKIIFGDNVDLSDESPNGVLVNAETLSRNGIAVNNANLANQINPRIAGGVFLDAIWALSQALTGGRNLASFSTFSTPPDLTGVAATLIPAGSIALVGENQFASVSDVTLDGAGEGSVNFQAVESGPIAADIGELNSIQTGAPLGWETINNTVAATLGTVKEADEVSRQRRINTLALQGLSISEAVTSALYDLDGVLSLAYRDNVEPTTEVIDGISLVSHSIWACVDGGLDQDIWDALVKNKTCGANWNGDETGTSTDETSGQIYDVAFDRPDEIQQWIRVTIEQTSVTNPLSVIQASILRYANGLMDGEAGFVVGANVSPYELAAAVNIDTPSFFVKNVELSDDGNTYQSTEKTIALDEVARTDSVKITMVLV